MHPPICFFNGWGPWGFCLYSNLEVGLTSIFDIFMVLSLTSLIHNTTPSSIQLKRRFLTPIETTELVLRHHFPTEFPTVSHFLYTVIPIDGRDSMMSPRAMAHS